MLTQAFSCLAVTDAFVPLRYEPKAGFFTDVKAAKAEMDEEDEADEQWAKENPFDAMVAAEEDDDEARAAAAKEKEEERAALELPDTPEVCVTAGARALARHRRSCRLSWAALL